jgi:hypothetical protein
MRRPLALSALLLALAAPAAEAKVKVGIADNKPDMFFDDRFAALGTKHVRKSVPWDVLRHPELRLRLDIWMAGAKWRGTRPLVSFDRSPTRTSYNPKPQEMVAAMRALRSRYGASFLREFAAWNEPNINKRPELVARWWLALERACKGCRVMPGELVDRKNAPSYARRVAKAAKKEPRLWGLHNYVDANNFRASATTAFLRQTQGEVWLTETGGVQSRANTSNVRFAGQGPDHAARATSYLFERLVGISPRIKRVYIYHWSSPPGDLTWDSGLVGPEGERPALAVVRQAMRGAIKPRKPKRAVASYKAPKGKGGRAR